MHLISLIISLQLKMNGIFNQANVETLPDYRDPIWGKYAVQTSPYWAHYKDSQHFTFQNVTSNTFWQRLTSKVISFCIM